MTLFVSYVPDETIEKDAQALLADYARVRGISIEAPIPIDDIIEKHLKIGIEFHDTHRLFGVPRSGIGQAPVANFVRGRISIAPFLGRVRVGIEAFVDHDPLLLEDRELFGKDPAQGSLLDGAVPPSVVCRSSQAKARIEVQADLYASCVLMPRRLVMAAWDDAFPDRKPRVLKPAVPIDHSFVKFSRETYVTPARVETETDDQALDRLATPFAKKFLVSPISMRIRLERLGLLHRAVPLQRLLANGS